MKEAKVLPTEHAKQEPAGDTTRDVSASQLDARAAIGQRLRKVYGQSLEEPLPDRFKELLDDLARKGSSQ